MATEVSTVTIATTALENGLSAALEEGKTDKSPGLSPSQKSPAAVVDPKLCGVCGDKALGNNFNAITCESCKAFFRRNALRTKEFVCPFNNNCKVDAITRRFCQRCRLKKCFDIGMKKEWIMTDEEKKIKKQKIEQNRKKRSSLENSGGMGESSPQGDEDVDLDDSPPVAKKSHMSVESNLDDQRLTESMNASSISRTMINGADSGDVPTVIGEVASGAALDETTPKLPKQPMGLHNQKQDSCRRKYSRQATASRKVVKGKSSSNTSNVIPIQVNTPLSAVATSAPSSPIPVSHQQLQFTSPVIDQQHDFHQQQHCSQEHVRQQEASHLPQQTAPLSAIWLECDSSNSSLSPPTPNSVSSQSRHQPPPLIKYPPNKRPRIYEHHETIEENLEANSAVNDQPTPLLSSLIHPSYPESSPDHTTSPPAPQLVQSMDPHSSGDVNEIRHHHQSPISYHRPSASPSDSLSPHHQMLQHDLRAQHSEHQNYHEYERSSPSQSHSPPILSSYQNDYHHHHYSPPYPVDSDNHSHHHHHFYQDNGQRHHHQQQQEQSQQMPMRIPSVSTIDSILSIAIAAEFNSFGMLGGNIPNSKELNKAEQAKLNELLLASQALHAPVDAERPIPKESGSSDPSLLNVINLTEIAIRRLIKMSKKISGFKNMCQEDQIALLKGSCTEMMILRSVVTYDPDRDSWQIPHSNPGYNINLGVLKEARGNLYEEHKRFSQSFRSQWRKNENIMIILCAITLFTPERHNVIHRDVVKLEQDSYYYLLKRYLESIMNGCEAKSNYLQLIHKIAELRALNSSHVRAYLEMNPKEVEPLLIEIFDLK